MIIPKGLIFHYSMYTDPAHNAKAADYSFMPLDWVLHLFLKDINSSSGFLSLEGELAQLLKKHLSRNQEILSSDLYNPCKGQGCGSSPVSLALMVETRYLEKSNWPYWQALGLIETLIRRIRQKSNQEDSTPTPDLYIHTDLKIKTEAHFTRPHK